MVVPDGEWNTTDSGLYVSSFNKHLAGPGFNYAQGSNAYRSDDS